MATHSSILAWEISQTEDPGGLHLWGHKESGTTEQLNKTKKQHSLLAYPVGCEGWEVLGLTYRDHTLIGQL